MEESSSVRRIALIEGGLAPSGDASVTTRLACKLKTAGREVAVVCHGGMGQQELKVRGIPAFIYPEKLRPWYFWRRPSIVKELADFKPDILHAQSHRLAPLANRLANALECPYIVTVNGHLGKRSCLPKKRRWMRLIITVNEMLREELVNCAKIPKEKIRQIPNGVDLASLKRFRPTEMDQAEEEPVTVETERVPEEADGLWNGHLPVVGMIAPLVKSKGQETFLRAAKEIIGKRAEVQFLLAGKGPEAPRMRALADKLGITGSLTFVDYVEEELGLLQAIDLFVLPAVQEGFGISVLEAMASGRPVVVSGVGGLLSIVKDRRTGLVVPRQDPAALAEAVLDLIENPELARSLSRQAAEDIEERFSQTVTFQKVFQTYEEAVAPDRNGKAEAH